MQEICFDIVNEMSESKMDLIDHFIQSIDAIESLINSTNSKDVLEKLKSVKSEYVKLQMLQMDFHLKFYKDFCIRSPQQTKQ